MYRCRLWLSHHEQREPVVSLAADGLDCGALEPVVGCRELEERAHALDTRVVALRVCDLALSHHVVGDDDGTRTRQGEREFEIPGVTLLVRVDEDEIKRFDALINELAHRRRRRSDTNLYA